MTGPSSKDLIFEIVRDEKRNDRTLGVLTVPGTDLRLDVLEDKVRPPGVKVYAETAIAEGLYRVVLSESPHFGRITPEILDVPNFTGIRIHCGVRPANTKGCPLVSSKGVTIDGSGEPVLIYDDRAGEDALTAALTDWTKANPGGKIWVRIRSEYPEPGKGAA